MTGRIKLDIIFDMKMRQMLWLQRFKKFLESECSEEKYAKTLWRMFAEKDEIINDYRY